MSGGRIKPMTFRTPVDRVETQKAPATFYLQGAVKGRAARCPEWGQTLNLRSNKPSFR